MFRSKADRHQQLINLTKKRGTVYIRSKKAHQKIYTQQLSHEKPVQIDKIKLELTKYLKKVPIQPIEQNCEANFISEDLNMPNKKNLKNYLKKISTSNYFRHWKEGKAFKSKWKSNQMIPDQQVQSIHKKSFNIKELKPQYKGSKNFFNDDILRFNSQEKIGHSAYHRLVAIEKKPYQGDPWKNRNNSMLARYSSNLEQHDKKIIPQSLPLTKIFNKQIFKQELEPWASNEENQFDYFA